MHSSGASCCRARSARTSLGLLRGLLNHHFGSIEALIADTYQKLASILTAVPPCFQHSRRLKNARASLKI